MKANYCLIMLLSLLKAGIIHAQGIDASPAGVMISHGHPKGGWMFSYTYMNMKMEDIMAGTEKVNDEYVFSKDYTMSPQNMNMKMHMLMAMCGVTKSLSLMLMAGYSQQTMEMLSYSATHVHNGMAMSVGDLHHTHHNSGLSDTKLWALYKLFSGEGSSLVLSMGLSLPTGNYLISAGEHAVVAGQRDSYMMQLGTGSYDFMPGITWIKKKNKLTWSTQALAVIRPFENSEGYHYGNELTVNGWASYGVVPWLSASARLEAISGGPIEGHDAVMYALAEPAADPDNYGGERANLYCGANLYINKSFMQNSKVGFEFGIPFYQNLNGVQLATKSKFNAGFTKSF